MFANKREQKIQRLAPLESRLLWRFLERWMFMCFGGSARECRVVHRGARKNERRRESGACPRRAFAPSAAVSPPAAEGNVATWEVGDAHFADTPHLIVHFANEVNEFHGACEDIGCHGAPLHAQNPDRVLIDAAKRKVWKYRLDRLDYLQQGSLDQACARRSVSSIFEDSGVAAPPRRQAAVQGTWMDALHNDHNAMWRG